MEKMLEEFIGKKVFIKLKNKRNYEGFIQTISQDNFLVITDKFGKKVGFRGEEVDLIQEEN